MSVCVRLSSVVSLRSFVPVRVGAALLFVSAGSVCHATGFNFTFDSDVQGWTRGELGPTLADIDVNGQGAAVWAPGGGNGHIRGSDHGAYAFHFSPDLGGGHGALFGQQIELEFSAVGTGGLNPFVVLLSSTAFLVKTQAHQGGGDWESFAYALDASAGWYFNSSPYYNGGSAVLATDADIQAVLNDLRHVAISTDIANGGDTTRTDNVRAVPAPSAIAFGLVGLVASARRRRN